MLTEVLKSYPYQEYADDDDIRALFDAYNSVAQAYVTWFATVNLPDYTGLSGDLLSWVSQGLYGITKTSLASPASASLGMLNTESLNSDVINGYSASTQTFYTLTDDMLQRILTWHFYKGDGKRFCIRWLKRRIMRFLLGTNGIDPQPTNPDFVVGCETTNALSVSVNPNTNLLTVTIYEVLLSQFAEVTPGVLSIFVIAFTSGVLELPVQYTYAVTIVAPLTVTVSPQSQRLTKAAATQTTGVSTVSVYAGSGSFAYAWDWRAGGTGIVINSPGSNASSFTLQSGILGEVYTGLAECVVTDMVTGQKAFATVTVSISCLAIALLTETKFIAGVPLLSESGAPLLLG